MVLYADYILIYLLNGWLKQQLVPILIFTGVFIAGYALIWFIIYRATKISTDDLNRKLNVIAGSEIVITDTQSALDLIMTAKFEVGTN